MYGPEKTRWWLQPMKKYWSNWIISPGKGQNKKHLKPPPRKNITPSLPISVGGFSCHFSPYHIHSASFSYLSSLFWLNESSEPTIGICSDPSLLLHSFTKEFFPFNYWSYFADTVLHKLIGSLPHYWQGSICARWCRISSNNNSTR